MRKIGILGLVGVLALVLAGCGGGDGHHTVVIEMPLGGIAFEDVDLRQSALARACKSAIAHFRGHIHADGVAE